MGSCKCPHAFKLEFPRFFYGFLMQLYCTFRLAYTDGKKDNILVVVLASIGLAVLTSGVLFGITILWYMIKSKL